MDDLVDIICSTEALTQKLVYENTKKSANSKLYEQVLTELKEKATDRGEIMDFTAEQLRNKFKSCVSWCKKAALTIKTKSGITRFRDDTRLGKWFMQLYPLVKSRDSCQREQGFEPGVDPIVDNEAENVEEPEKLNIQFKLEQ